MSHAVLVRPLHSAEDYESAMARIREIFYAKPGSPESDELDILWTLAEAFEREHYPLPPPDPVGALKFWMDQHDLRQADLIPYLGASSRVSEILSGKRKLTVEMIRKLHEGLGIPTDCLIGK
jgi:HTH-type transcriptional regulator/antitoxin HigA